MRISRIRLAEVTYDDLAGRLKTALADAKLTAQADKWTDRYLALSNTKLKTKRQYVRNAFVLCVIFMD